MDESEVLKFEQQVRPMRLSEAIRIGAKIRPQIRNGLLYENGATCALGAAAEARGWDCFMSGLVRRQFLSDVSAELWFDIAQMNDGGQSREQIADWLESQGY